MERVGTVVIGGGQAGLTMGYRLQRCDEDFVILEGAPRVGDSWRRHYDALRLFSLPRYASLPGWRNPAVGCPTRDEMADYIEEYASRFALPVRTRTRVEKVIRDGDGFVVAAGSGTYVTDRVVVTVGNHELPTIPGLASALDPSLAQLHSLDYKGPHQLAGGGVLVVGAANSGSDVALEAAAAGHPTWVAGRHPGEVPVDIDRWTSRPVVHAVMFAQQHVLTRRTPMGRAFIAKHTGHGIMLIRNKRADLTRAGVRLIGPIESVRDGRAVSSDGVCPEVATVVWCTGSRPDHSFLRVPGAFGSEGEPLHERGVSVEPGLYFLGLDFQYAVASATIQGLDRDARYLVRKMRGSRARGGATHSARATASDAMLAPERR